MKFFYNTREEFGDAGPHEAESPEALADEMTPLFRQWAGELLDSELLEDEEPITDEADWIEACIAQQRKDFLEGLEEHERCESCGHIEACTQVDDDVLCESCAGEICGCPSCGELTRRDHIVETPVGRMDPPEYGCPSCSTGHVRTSRQWKRIRDEETADQRYDEWKDEGKPGGRYGR